MTRPMDPVQRVRRRRTWWELLAWGFVIVLAVTGLAVVAVYILLVVSLNSGGNNK